MKKLKKIFKRKQRTVAQQIRRKTIVAFTIFFVLIAIGYRGWMWLYHQPESASGAKPILRSGLQTNESIFRKIFGNEHLAKTYPRSAAAKQVRVNGSIGMQSSFDYKNWKLQLVRGPKDTILVSLDDIRRLPKTEVIFDFKCVEGWSQVSHWGGVRFRDFAKHYGLDTQTALQYVGMCTPDKKYYVGIDMPSMMHPQTLLCYEMNGTVLPLSQGYPLRLIIPVKYGIKNIKRIGTLYFSNTPPPDYWAERGYDYYSGL